MSTARQPYRDVFRSGESVPHSGLYRVEHRDEAECNPVQMVLITGDRFPDCPNCGGNAQFTLLHAVPYIHEDPDFRKE